MRRSGTAKRAGERVSPLTHEAGSRNEILEAAVQQMPCAIVVLEGPAGERARASRRAEKLFGMSGADLRRILLSGHGVTSRARGAPFRTDELPARRSLSAAERIDREPIVYLRPDGRELALVLSSAPLLDAARRIIGAIVMVEEASTDKPEPAEDEILTNASSVLAPLLEHDAVAAAFASLLVPQLGDWCVIDGLRPDGSLSRIAGRHVDPDKVRALDQLSLRIPEESATAGDVSYVTHTGEVDWNRGVTDVGVLASALGVPEQRDTLELLGIQGYVLAPLVARARVLGVVLLVRAGGQFRQEDVTIVRRLALQAAYALDNARAYDEARRGVSARDSFLSMASHELRTPLTALQLQLDSLLRLVPQAGLEGRAQEKMKVGLQKIERQTKRLEKLTHELIDVARFSTGKVGLDLTEVDLVAFARDIVDRFRDQAEVAGCKLDARGAGEIIGNWDCGRLDRVVSNLVSNAIKYGAGKPIDVSVEKAGERARLTVRDEGIGIAPESQKRIFERFERAIDDEHYSGFGLGLWIAREMVDAMGGTITLASAPGAGATFSLELPLS